MAHRVAPVADALSDFLQFLTGHLTHVRATGRRGDAFGFHGRIIPVKLPSVKGDRCHAIAHAVVPGLADAAVAGIVDDHQDRDLVDSVNPLLDVGAVLGHEIEDEVFVRLHVVIGILTPHGAEIAVPLRLDVAIAIGDAGTGFVRGRLQDPDIEILPVMVERLRGHHGVHGALGQHLIGVQFISRKAFGDDGDRHRLGGVGRRLHVQDRRGIPDFVRKLIPNVDGAEIEDSAARERELRSLLARGMAFSVGEYHLEAGLRTGQQHDEIVLSGDEIANERDGAEMDVLAESNVLHDIHETFSVRPGDGVSRQRARALDGNLLDLRDQAAAHLEPDNRHQALEMDGVRQRFGGRIGQRQPVGNAARDGRLLVRKGYAIDQFVAGETILVNAGIENVIRGRQRLRDTGLRRKVSVGAAFGRGKRGIIQVLRRCFKGIHLKGISRRPDRGSGGSRLVHRDGGTRTGKVRLESMLLRRTQFHLGRQVLKHPGVVRFRDRFRLLDRIKRLRAARQCDDGGGQPEIPLIHLHPPPPGLWNGKDRLA